MTDDEQEIRELAKTWISASKSGDLQAVLALMTDDVIFMTPSRRPFGKDEFAANAKAMDGLTLDGSSDIQEIEIFGARAYIRSHIQISLTRPGQAPQRMSGYAMSILRKEADGRWRIARDANLVMSEA